MPIQGACIFSRNSRIDIIKQINYLIKQSKSMNNSENNQGRFNVIIPPIQCTQCNACKHFV